jgi:NADP-dependent 3-hydroxy acid dehydrogenase YdfG
MLQIRKEYERLDVFINNAGILMTSFITEDDPNNIRKLFEVNVIASCVCLKEAVNLMKENSGKGHVIIMNSILGHRIPDIPPTMRPPFGLYPASKHALLALAQSLRQELSYLKLPIKITSISPGMVETDILAGFNQQLVAMLPKLKVEDITEAVKYVLNTPDRVRVRKLF